MSFAIHGLGTAHPPDAVTAEEGLALGPLPGRAGRPHFDVARSDLTRTPASQPGSR